ncbi:MAG TPA: hypothetical protein PKA90_09250 [Ignavibacteria bacterium]|nr:hypothetical protein [Ignavibacteria bacterium]HMR40602.1 hypothetical protein [Ignavibacteria bacterium]
MTAKDKFSVYYKKDKVTEKKTFYKTFKEAEASAGSEDTITIHKDLLIFFTNKTYANQ